MNDEVHRAEEVKEQEEDPHERRHQRTTILDLPDGSNILSPAGIRCCFQSPSRLVEFLLAYHLRFLLPIGLFLWIVFLLFQRS